MVLRRFKHELGRRFGGNFQSVSSRLTGFPWLIDVRAAGFLVRRSKRPKLEPRGCGVFGVRVQNREDGAYESSIATDN
jgi:hypothetical protein